MVTICSLCRYTGSRDFKAPVNATVPLLLEELVPALGVHSSVPGQRCQAGLHRTMLSVRTCVLVAVRVFLHAAYVPCHDWLSLMVSRGVGSRWAARAVPPRCGRQGLHPGAHAAAPAAWRQMLILAASHAACQLKFPTFASPGHSICLSLLLTAVSMKQSLNWDYALC